MKPKGVTTQMNALDDYFLMVVFTLVPNRVHGFANFFVGFEQCKGKKWAWIFQIYIYNVKRKADIYNAF